MTDEITRAVDVAPKDGSMLWLLVDYDQGEHPLEDAPQTWTIGFNNLDNTGDDEWQFAGWNWSQDHFTEGKGTVIGWLPCNMPNQRARHAN